MSGANKVPLGKFNPFGSQYQPASGGSLLKPSYMASDGSDKRDRDRDYKQEVPPPPPPVDNLQRGTKRERDFDTNSNDSNSRKFASGCQRGMPIKRDFIIVRRRKQSTRRVRIARRATQKA